MISFGLPQMFHAIFVIAMLIAWFNPKEVEIPNTLTSNDHSSWSKFERLKSEEDYIDWHSRIPDGTRWLGYEAPTAFPVLFSRNDLIVAPIPKDESRYNSYSSRLFGRIVVLHGTKYASGKYAQEISIPSNALLLFHPESLVLVADVVVVGASLSLPILFTVLRNAWRRKNAR